MSDDSLPPLGAELRKAIASARHIERADEELRTRLRSRIATAIASASIDISSPSEAASVPLAQSAASSAASISGAVTAKIAGALLVGLAIGGTGGVVVGRMTAEPTVVRVEVPAASSANELPPPTASTGETIAPQVSVETNPSERNAAARASAETDSREPEAPTRRVTHTDLEAEQTLIDAARAALARDNPEQASELLARHRVQFPSGALREEREGLEVLALLRTDPERARRAAARFARRYPESLLLPAIERALPRDANDRESP